MATVKLQHKIFDNFSGGYANEQAYVSEDRVSMIGDSKNVDIYSTENNGGYGFRKAKGNTLYKQFTGEKVKGLFVYEASKTVSYLIVHTVNSTEGKLYYINTVGTPVLLKSGLNKDAINGSFVNFSQTLPTKRFLGIFGNGVDPFIKIELGANPEVEEIDAEDSENRDIRGNTLETFYGRVWCGVDNRIHWSKSLDPFVWATQTDDAGYQELDGEVTAVSTYAGGLLISTTKSIYYCSKDTEGFAFTTLSPNHALSNRSIVKHENYALYIAEDGIYPINATQEDTKKVADDVSWLINNYFGRKNIYDTDNIFATSVTCQEKNEVWFNIPILGDEQHSYIFVYRFITGRQKTLYWLPPRIQQKINCLCVFKNMLLSGTDSGEILQEMTGKTFNGDPIVAIAEFPDIDFNGTYNKQKFKMFLYSELEENNRFYVDYFFDGEADYDRQEVILENITFCWNEGNWNEENWSPDVTLEYKLDKPRKHKKLKIRFVAEGADQDFIINKIMTSNIKVKDK